MFGYYILLGLCNPKWAELVTYGVVFRRFCVGCVGFCVAPIGALYAYAYGSWCRITWLHNYTAHNTRRRGQDPARYYWFCVFARVRVVFTVSDIAWNIYARENEL